MLTTLPPDLGLLLYAEGVCKTSVLLVLFAVPAVGAKTKIHFHVSLGFHGLAEKYTEQILVLGVCKKKKIHGLFLDLPWHSPSLVGVISIVKLLPSPGRERGRVQKLGKYKSELLRVTQIYTHPVMDVIVCKRRERRSSFWHHCALLETYGPDIWDFLYVLSDQQNLMLGRPFFHGCPLVF